MTLILPWLAFRNVRLNFIRRLFVVLVIALTLAVLLVGNTVFQGTESGIMASYRDSFTGDLSISAKSDDPFTVFGSDLPLIGDYQALPVLSDPKRIEQALAKYTSVRGIAHLVSAAAIMQVADLKRTSPLFGVNFTEYFGLFPALKIIEGSVPQPEVRALFLNSSRKTELEAALGRALIVGEPIQLVSSNAGGFTIREVPYAGMFQYPVSDELLNRIVLVDADTARSLNGYVYSGGRQVVTKADETQLLTDNSSVDDLFGDVSDKGSSGVAMSLGAVDQFLASKDRRGGTSSDGAWNFILVRLEHSTNAEWEVGALKAALPNRGVEVQVRDWRGTAGGNAQLVYFVRLLFNVGMILVVLLAVFVMTNSLALSVHERTREIGTMRAVGATKGFVGRLLSWEVFILVGGAGILGLLIGVAGLEVLKKIGIPLLNPLLASLFGTKLVRPVVLWDVVAWHMVLVVLMGFGALLLPLRAALGMSPLNAMSKDA